MLILRTATEVKETPAVGRLESLGIRPPLSIVPAYQEC